MKKVLESRFSIARAFIKVQGVMYDFVKIDLGLALAHALQNLLVQKIDEMMYAPPTEEKKEEEEPSLNKNFQVQVHAVANSSSF